MSPSEEDGGGYGAFTLPCRRSHCLSEGLAGLGAPAAPCPGFQGRRAQTTQVRLYVVNTLINMQSRRHVDKVFLCPLSVLYALNVEDFVYQQYPGSSHGSKMNILWTTTDVSCAWPCCEVVYLYTSK